MGGRAVEGMMCFAYLTELVTITAFFYNAIIILATLFAGLPASDLCVLHSLTVRVSYAYDTDGLHSVLQVRPHKDRQWVSGCVEGGGGMVRCAYLTELVTIAIFFYNAIIILAPLFAGLQVSMWWGSGGGEGAVVSVGVGGAAC
jgi:hypothetical protein